MTNTIRILQNHNHPLHKSLLLNLIPSSITQTGIQRIGALLCQLLNGPPLECLTPTKTPFLSPNCLTITGTKETATFEHPRWLDSIHNAWVIYSDGSKHEDGTCSSRWNILLYNEGSPTKSFTGACNIGHHSENEDAEIHGIQEALAYLIHQVLVLPRPIHLCIDNQNALKALTGAPTLNVQFLNATLKHIQTLHNLRCDILCRWTPSHTKIPGHESADLQAKQGYSLPPCQHSVTTLGWLSLQPKRNLLRKWQEQSYSPVNTHPPPILRFLCRSQARAISLLRTELTSKDANPLQPANTCTCGALNSSRHLATQCTLNTHTRPDKSNDWTQSILLNNDPTSLLHFIRANDLSPLNSKTYLDKISDPNLLDYS